jgi:hypothetical protein
MQQRLQTTSCNSFLQQRLRLAAANPILQPLQSPPPLRLPVAAAAAVLPLLLLLLHVRRKRLCCNEHESAQTHSSIRSTTRERSCPTSGATCPAPALCGTGDCPSGPPVKPKGRFPPWLVEWVPTRPSGGAAHCHRLPPRCSCRFNAAVARSRPVSAS